MDTTSVSRKSIRIVVFGARGRVGRAVVAEARARGYGVTETGRADGDVTSAADVERLAAGHDVAVVAVHDAQAAPGVFFPAVARALAAGLPRAGVRRLVVVGLASVLPTESGEPLMDTPGYPQEWREFYVGHAAGTEALRAQAPAGLDWAVLSPAGDFAGGGGPDAGGTGGAEAGGYAVPVPADAASRITHAGFARAVVDEAGPAATVHAVHAGVGPA